MKIVPVILCGGSGTRLWPVSRKNAPKQFVDIIGEHTFFEVTLSRLKAVSFFTPPLVLCNEDNKFICVEQLENIGIEPLDIIVEPVGRNTMAAITTACLRAKQIFEESVQILVLPADHFIDNTDYYFDMIKQASHCAKQSLITFGIKPECPHTGYGYLRKGMLSQDIAYQVEQFIEKPSLGVAETLIQSNDVYWNSGIFLLDIALLLAEAKRYVPGIVKLTERALFHAKRNQSFLLLDFDFFNACDAISIDYALLEKTDKLAMVPLNLKFIDIGTWESLYEYGTKDQHDNVSEGDVYAEDTWRCLLHSNNKLLVTVGLTDCVVVVTQDSVLVSKKGCSQQIKKILPRLTHQHAEKLNNLPVVRRPWGSYEVLSSESGYKVKRLVVRPGARLSLQLHEHRSEHWVVVSGQADIICGENQYTLNPHDSFYIPKKTKHRISNKGGTPLVVIETQIGDHVSESDIVRFEDVYNRVESLVEAF